LNPDGVTEPPQDGGFIFCESITDQEVSGATRRSLSACRPKRLHLNPDGVTEPPQDGGFIFCESITDQEVSGADEA
jgi:hypothetical protein